MNKIEKRENCSNQTFEEIKHIDENGIEYWYARELMKIFGYKDWRYFDAVIEKARIACKNTGINDVDHFVVNNKMVEIGSGAKRQQKDYKLTRYACYLIAQNANPRLKRDKVDTENKACDTHNKIGKIVRKAIKEAGGTMPEDLPTPKKSLKELEKENKKALKRNEI